MLQEFDSLMKVVSRHLANFSQMMHLTLREITQLAETNKLNQHGSYSSFIFTRPYTNISSFSQFLRVAPNSSVESAHVQVNFVLDRMRCSNKENIRIPSGSPGFDSRLNTTLP